MSGWLYWLFPRWWNDSRLLAQIQTATGILALGVSGVLGYFAWRIARRQMDMQAEQHKFFQDERGRRPHVVLVVTGIAPLDHGATRLTISARNGGKGPASGFSWEIVLPASVESFAHFREENGKPTP